MTRMTGFWPSLRMATVRGLLGVALGAMCVGVLAASGDSGNTGGKGTLTAARSFSSAIYTPSETLDVTITIDPTEPEIMTSLSVFDTIPAGWTYDSVAISGGSLLIQPPPGASGELGFSWLFLPTSWPATLTYTVNVPSDAAGDQTFTGNVKFREDAGEITVPMDDSVIDDGIRTVTFVAGANGSLVGDPVQQVLEGTDASPVEAAPDAGYAFAGWTSGGSAYSSANPLTVTNVTEDITITAEFEVITHTVDFVAGANGSLTGDTSQVVNQGDDATAVTAVPDANYHVVHWMVDGAVFSTDNPLTVTNVMMDMTVTAVFEIDTFTVNFVAGANGSVEGATTQTVAFDSDASPVTAVPDEGYHFVKWTEDGADFSMDNPLTVTNVTEDMTLTAHFEINEYTVAFIAGANGTLTGDLNQTIVHGNDATAVTATPDENYVFSEWTMDGASFSNDNPLTVTNVTQDMTLTAVFVPNQHTVTISAGTGGSVSGELTQTVDHGADLSPVTATPDEGYVFDGWYADGAYITAANPLTLMVMEDMAITAQFEPEVYKVTFLAGANGSLEGDTVQMIEHGQDTTPVTAVPDGFYAFLQWSDGSTENPRTITNVTSNITVTAEFGDPPPVDPDGVFGVFVDDEEACDGLGLWDFTGHYEVAVGEYMLVMDLTQDAKGKLDGVGELIKDDVVYLKAAACEECEEFFIPLEIKGQRVKGKDGVVTLKIKMKGASACVPCTPQTKLKANIKMELTLDAGCDDLVGITDAKVKVGRDKEKLTVDSVVDVPEDMDGSWSLMMELFQEDKKVEGTAVVELSNETAFMLVLKGRTAKDDMVKIKIKHDKDYDPTAKGIKIKLQGVPLADHTFDVEKAKVKALGQKIDYDGDDDLEIE